MTTLPDLLRGHALVEHLTRQGAHPALRQGKESVTYADLADRVSDVAEAYAGGRRLVLLTPRNDVASVVEYLGAMAAGQVVLMCAPASRDALVAAYDPDVVASGVAREWRREGSVHDLHPDLALLLSTSGSTGSPKLVRLSRDGLVANARAIAASLHVREDDLAALNLPLHYCYGLSVLHSHLLRGAALLLSEASVTDEDFWQQARDVTTLAGVPHTFDLLERGGFAERDLPRLRYLTQAGGRLAPERVRAWAELGRERGWDFVVMYGQTEATSRLSVLPPDRVLDAPTSIGLPIDEVTFTLAPADHPDADVGELVARGPGVMLGYAESPADLALGRTTHALHTGDLARRRDDGLWEIVGRRSRFAKVCGLRIDLDHVERSLAAEGFVTAAADGGDRVVLGVACEARAVDVAAVEAAATRVCGLAPTGVCVVTVPDLPRLANDKVDYRGVLAAVAVPAQRSSKPRMSPATAADIVGLYARLLRRPDARPTDSFVSLGGDSLSYVEVSLRLEALLGDLPAGWPHTPAAALADAPLARRRRGTLVETNVVMRALAILTIVATHANAFGLLGGAHLLIAIAGFNLARFQLTGASRPQRTRRILTSAARVAVPSALVIGVFSLVGLWAEGLTWRQVLLVNGLTSASWSEPGWYFWFIEALVHTLVLLALFLSIPRVDALERARPFAFPMGLVAVAMLTRYDVINVPGDAEHRAHVIFWLFALGWAAARAGSTRQRLLVSVVTVVTMVGAFPQWERDAYVALGMLALVWVPRVRVPRAVAGVAGVLAAASLWIYLTHWQVYPHLEGSWPWLALALSLLVGVVLSGAATRLERLVLRR
ncbi:AMP-dependent synthetase [Nocardioides seonyuensis]|uniref:AMP-dependent synthetase n=1 Tax=Nocardioides seonyuensis TaxID=2518371 RepID=A0A4P7ICJ5_9ACTN|nr:AMP-binding protein [Nocardioides seonyuensis]QBX54828.1 AMP-dependent synthetase [Nocardioides seonyuensis]